MKRATAKAKGKAFERAVRDFYRRLGWSCAERTPNSGAMAQWPGDLLYTDPFLIECKADEQLSVWAAIKQAQAGADRVPPKDNGREMLPVVHMRRSNGRGVPPTCIVAMPEYVWATVLEMTKTMWGAR